MDLSDIKSDSVKDQPVLPLILSSFDVNSFGQQRDSLIYSSYQRYVVTFYGIEKICILPISRVKSCYLRHSFRIPYKRVEDDFKNTSMSTS